MLRLSASFSFGHTLSVSDRLSTLQGSQRCENRKQHQRCCHGDGFRGGHVRVHADCVGREEATEQRHRYGHRPRRSVCRTEQAVMMVWGFTDAIKTFSEDAQTVKGYACMVCSLLWSIHVVYCTFNKCTRREPCDTTRNKQQTNKT